MGNLLPLLLNPSAGEASGGGEISEEAAQSLRACGGKEICISERLKPSFALRAHDRGGIECAKSRPQEVEPPKPKENSKQAVEK